MILRRFFIVLNNLQNSGINTEEKTSVFFRAAEIRYLMWLDLLLAKSKEGKVEIGRLTEEYLPPW